MNSSVFSLPARRAAAVLTAAALTAGPAALLAAVPAHATGGEGKAGAVVLRAGLDVSLLNKTVEVPLTAALNEVSAPADARKTALSVTLDGVDRGRPFNVLRADVATARATADKRKAEGYANLARARVHVPGLPLLSLIEVEQVTSKAVCVAGKRPSAESNLLGSVRVLGKRVTLSTGGTTRVEVPGVGEVRLDLSKTRTTSRTAAATALELSVSINPLKLNVAEVEGKITLVQATCETPKGAGPKHTPKPSEKPQGTGGKGDGGKGEDVSTQTVADKPAAGSESLAETGGSSTTPYIAGGAAALLIVGGGAIALARGRRS